MYLTVKEAIDASNKSQTTIHRLCQKYENTKFVKKEGNKFLIDKEFLLEKYPADSEDDEITESMLKSGDDNLIKLLTEKNEQISELTLKNKNLEEQISEFKEEIFDQNHEMAQLIDANMSLNKELSALRKNKTDIKIASTAASETSDSKKIFIYKTLSITGSLIILLAFLYLMYYFTHNL